MSENLDLKAVQEMLQAGGLRGIFKVQETAYHTGPGISRSDLDWIDVSPAHFREYKSQAFEQTDALIFGQAVHHALFEPEIFRASYVKKPDNMNFATKDGRAWKIAHDGKVILKAVEMHVLEGMVREMKRHPAVSKMFTGGLNEICAYTNDVPTGLLLRARADYYIPSLRTIIDLKTTTDARPREFQRSFYNNRYHVQAAFYTDVFGAASGVAIENFIIVAVEKSRPYGIKAYRVSEAAMEYGRKEYRQCLTEMQECLVSDQWPCYPPQIEEIGLPGWVPALEESL